MTALKFGAKAKEQKKESESRELACNTNNSHWINQFDLDLDDDRLTVCSH